MRTVLDHEHPASPNRILPVRVDRPALETSSHIRAAHPAPRLEIPLRCVSSLLRVRRRKEAVEHHGHVLEIQPAHVHALLAKVLVQPTPDLLCLSVLRP
jgi:hypothetical protein